jgi:hypothetical protein
MVYRANFKGNASNLAFEVIIPVVYARWVTQSIEGRARDDITAFPGLDPEKREVRALGSMGSDPSILPSTEGSSTVPHNTANRPQMKRLLTDRRQPSTVRRPRIPTSGT